VGCRAADVFGFRRIDGIWTSRGDVAESAGARAYVAENHHRRMTLRPAFTDVGTGGFLTNCIQAQVPHELAGLVIFGRCGRLDSDPGRLPQGRTLRAIPFLRVPKCGHIAG